MIEFVKKTEMPFVKSLGELETEDCELDDEKSTIYRVIEEGKTRHKSRAMKH